jgi:threonine/homoserine/homoserine lactone efflux protein
MGAIYINARYGSTLPRRERGAQISSGLDLWLAGLIAAGIGFVGSMPLTGPVAALIVSRSAEKQYGEATRVGLGAAVAEALYAGLAYFGFATFFGRHPLVLPIARAVSAVVLVGTGVAFAFWHPKTGRAATQRHGKARGWLLGFSASALNPMLLFTWTGAVSILYGHGLAPRDALAPAVFGTGAGVGIGCWQLVLIALFRKTGSRLPRRVLTWMIRIMGGVIAIAGLYSGFEFVHSVR